MVYREYDDAQLRNKIEVLEARIKELEEENNRLKMPKVDKRTPHNTPMPFDDTKQRLEAAIKKNPEFFMSTKEKKLLREKTRKQRKAESMKNFVEKWKMTKHIIFPDGEK